ncbi:unnamed protein product [Owenia fusiformis]|uniref:Uncharacterized protein n=1 Tax=Owenia fusiformis TaxID=6347 RepID=A0A8J1TAP1_OWEFU|nr:unnamed protein product [Owenia fusiformis]
MESYQQNGTVTESTSILNINMTESPINTTGDESRTSNYDPCNDFDLIIYTILIGIISVIGLTGNTLSIIVLEKERNKSTTSLLLQSLAVSDNSLLILSLLAFTIPQAYLYTGNVETWKRIMYILERYIAPLLQMPHIASVGLTVVVTINRYIALCRPLTSMRWETHFRVRLQITAVVLFSILYNVPRFFDFYVIGYESNNKTMPLILGYDKTYNIAYRTISYILVMYTVPLLTLAILNTKLIIELKKAAKERVRISTCSRSMRRNEQVAGHQHDVTLILIVVVIVFIVCQTPCFVNQFLWLFRDPPRCGEVHYYYTRTSDMLAILNSSVNFFVYCLFGKKFRQTLANTFECRRKSRRLVLSFKSMNGSGRYNTNGFSSPNTTVTTNTENVTMYVSPDDHFPQEVGDA